MIVDGDCHNLYLLAFEPELGKNGVYLQKKIGMRSLLTICFVMASVLSVSAQQSVDDRLREAGERDQQVRLKLVEAQQRGQVDSLIYYAEQMVRIDAENQAVVAELIRVDVPDALSEEAYDAIFLVVDHADLDYQRRYFRTLSRAAEQGKIARSSMATLRDRMLMRRNRKQVYGTQTVGHTTIVEGEQVQQQVNYVWPIKRVRKVEERRAEVGLSTMQGQAEAHEKMGYRLVWDRRLSVREFRLLTEREE